MIDTSRSKEIIEAIKTGDNSKALNHLYKTALPRIIRFITQNKGDVDEAKDIFQDAVLALYNTVKLGKFDSNKDINGFLYHVSKNLWINRIKRKNKQCNIVDTELPFAEESPLAVIITDEKKEAIADLMDKVGGHCKDLLKYTMYDRLSMKEVAVKMNFAGETVAKSAHYRCKQKLLAMISTNKTLISLFNE